MKITWLGHSCFCLESGGYRIVVDPYRMDSYPPLQTCANAVYGSHGHYDHTSTEAVTRLEEKPSPFTVEEIQTFHDDQGGALRGGNTMRAFCAEGLRVVHCGDLGHWPDEEQRAFLMGSDVLMLPVGGYYTIDAAEAEKIVDAVCPRTVLPMHYRFGEHGMDVLSEVTAFTELFPAEHVTRLDGNSVTVDKETPNGVILLQFKEKGE